MTLRFGLCDQQRTGLTVSLAPDNLHAVVTDNLGRVMLIDCFRGIAVRVWKGYRDAQCSFVKVIEKPQQKSSSASDQHRRQALFLVIFAPRRSCLEIWGLQRGGQKVAAFAADKSGQLIYNPHSLVGVSGGGSSSGAGGGGSRVKYPPNSCVFLDPADQTLKEIVVPFHCAVTDANSKTAKDLHLLRRIKMLLRNGGDSDEQEQVNEMRAACQALQTDEIRMQCIEMMVKNSKIRPNVLEVALHEIREAILNEDVDDPSTTTTMAEQMQRSHLHCVAMNYWKLVEFYLYIKGLKTRKIVATDEAKTTMETDDDATDRTEPPVKLSVSDTELINLQKFIDLTVMENGAQRTGTRVTFNDNTKSNEFVEYLTVLNCAPTSMDDMMDDTIMTPELSDVSNNLIRLKSEHRNLWASVGGDIFAAFLERGKSLTDFLHQSQISRIAAEDLLKLFLLHWLDKPFSYTKR